MRLSRDTAAPLDEIEVTPSSPGTVVALDGLGRPYLRRAVTKPTRVTVGGALGRHTLLLLDEHEQLVAHAGLEVDARTEIVDEGDRFGALLRLARWTLHDDYNTQSRHIRIGDRVYHFLVHWLRDHVLTLEGARWFQDELRSGIDLYADHQREDGMIWDNVFPHEGQGYWDTVLREGDFMRDVEDAHGGRLEFKRIPVTNDVEALFVEGLYLTWQATHDDEWMKGRLDAALAALDYSRTDPLRWSKRFDLLKRGYTIDTWDFRSQWDADHDTGHVMTLSEKSEMGVCFGDNLLYASACEHLAAMLEAVDRGGEAEALRARATEIRERTSSLAFLGTHFHHHVPENPEVERDLGIDDRTQVSLSNAYALGRGVPMEQADAIIGTYQALRDRLPEGSPGEWYSIHPPFPRGFPNAPKWEYVNGGVLPMVAAELARGSLRHGHEAYGVEVLERLLALGRQHGDVLHGTYRGSSERPPRGTFTPVDLQRVVNGSHPPLEATREGRSLWPDGDPSPTPWATEFAGVPFTLLDRRVHPGRSALMLHCDHEDGADEARVRLRREAASVYLLHEADGLLAGTLHFEYADGETRRLPVHPDKFGNWWTKPRGERPRARLGWRSDGMKDEDGDGNIPRVALYVIGIDNPRPDQSIRALRFEATPEGRWWRVLGVTLSDVPAAVQPEPISFGIPQGWGAGATIRALIEGLGGVEDRSAGLRSARLCPRWAATASTRATVCARYGDGNGYVRYRYEWSAPAGPLKVDFTGTADDWEVELLLPEGFAPRALTLDGDPREPTIRRVRQSAYLVTQVSGVGPHSLLVS